MALTMWGQVIIQTATPGEAPVQVGTLWIDTSGTATLKVCTSISPYTFASISGGSGALDDLSDVVITSAATGDYIRFNGTNWVDVAASQLATDLAGDFAALAHATRHKSGGADAIKLDELAAPTDVTTLDASTTLHGLAPKAVAPAAGLLSALGIGNGETAFTNKPLFDTTNPAALGTAAPGTQLVAARRDHVHANPAIDTLAAATDITTLNATTSAHGLMPKGGNDTTKFYRGDTTQAVPDHGSIGGLTDDDHAQYALLAGRSGGQTLKGGTGASEVLTLSSTNHATKGVVTLADEVLTRAELRDHHESKDTGTISAGTLAVDYTTAAVFAVSLDAAITSFTIANPAPTGKHCAVTFIFTADGTIRAITWPTGTVWPAATAPTMTGTLNKRDIITLVTFDAGTTWFGIIVGQNY